MNTLETHTETIFGKTDVCAKLTIDDITSKFMMTNLMKVGEQYTLGFWIRSDSAGGISVCGVSIPTSEEWSRHENTFPAETTSLALVFERTGVYYIYHAQLEVGSVATDYRPAPEDLSAEEDLKDLNDRVQHIHEEVAQLDVTASGISGRVSSVEESLNATNGEVLAAKSRIAAMELTTEQFGLQFKDIDENGVKKVTTETGFTFDREGMTVDNSDSPTKTQVTPKGMTVYKKDAAGTQEAVLQATDEGVRARDLYAETYLIVGGRSRFENFGNRTGCFWIGGS